MDYRPLLAAQRNVQYLAAVVQLKGSVIGLGQSVDEERCGFDQLDLGHECHHSQSIVSSENVHLCL